jgi:hypothetical protein
VDRLLGRKVEDDEPVRTSGLGFDDGAVLAERDERVEVAYGAEPLG